MATINETLAALRKFAPKRSEDGQLYSVESMLRGRWRTVRMWTVLASSAGNYRTHQCVFKKDAGRDAAEWAAFFQKHFSEIYSGAILPGLNKRDSSQIWSVQRVIGWTAEGRAARTTKRKTKAKAKGKRRAKFKSRNPRMAARRNKTKSSRRKNG